MKKLIYIAIALLFCTTAYAGKTTTYYQMETYNAARVAYELLDCTEDFSAFYWEIQLYVNDWAESYVKRERNRLAPLVSWAVLDALYKRGGCT